MEEQQQSAPETQSLGSRIMNVFSSPGEAFDGITTLESKTSLWLVPFLLAMVIAAAFSFVISSNESLRSQIIEMQRIALDEQVAKGNMTQAQADLQVGQMERAGMLFAVFGAIFQVIGIAFTYFVFTLLLWLLGRFALGGVHGYSTYLAMYGTTSWIFVLGYLVTALMMVGLNSMFATPSAALAVLGEYDFRNSTHKLLSQVELFGLWQSIVIGIGLSKLANKSVGVGIGVSLGLLIAWKAVSFFVFGQ